MVMSETPSAEPVPYDTTRIWTVPNVLSFIRLLGVPLFLWFVLGPHWDVWAVVVIAVASLTDFFDGWLARTLHQVSRLGQVLDPIADRVYICAIIIALAARGFLPWVLVILVIARDVMLAALLPSLRKRGYSSLPVHFLGKIATFCLLYAFPCILLGMQSFHGASVFLVMGWAVAIWATFLYWWAGILYMYQGISFIRRTPVENA
ncbi:MAG: CDP-alcohol phosphatidyltransferase family protein [Propionibacteriaceae bacterium]|jgi:cardiolipin synthase|nr:CDP-alcohol phosphatidyltransferase family protein [Propionibacteriaceae bacterium]